MDLCGRRDNEFPGFVSAQEKSLLVILSGWEGGLPVGEKVTRFYFTEEAGQAMQSLVWVSRMGITLTGIPAIVFVHVWDMSAQSLFAFQEVFGGVLPIRSPPLVKEKFPRWLQVASACSSLFVPGGWTQSCRSPPSEAPSGACDRAI